MIKNARIHWPAYTIASVLLLNAKLKSEFLQVRGFYLSRPFRMKSRRFYEDLVCISMHSKITTNRISNFKLPLLPSCYSLYDIKIVPVTKCMLNALLQFQFEKSHKTISNNFQAKEPLEISSIFLFSCTVRIRFMCK